MGLRKINYELSFLYQVRDRLVVNYDDGMVFAGRRVIKARRVDLRGNT